MTEAGEQAMDARTNEALDRLARAEAFVRDCLSCMGQPQDASDPWLVRGVALDVLAAVPSANAA